MTDYKNAFITWYFNEFTITPMFGAMIKTRENSPWHREGTVGIHTNMVVAHFISSIASDKQWDRDDVARALVCAFHDVGKPAAKTPQYNEERGHYFRFSGHELKSARIWEDYAALNWKKIQDLFNLTPTHIFKIGWMIEHHKPWDVKKPAKLEKMARTVSEISWADAFGDVILADTYGRIQDDRAASVDQATNWISNFIDITSNLDCERERSLTADMPIVTFLIGASGSGKSTWTKNNGMGADVFSFDQLRLDWYDAENYSNAFKLSCEDSKFNTKANSTFLSMLKNNKDIIIDNTNLGTKRRQFFVTEAIKKGYKTKAVLFPISMSELMLRPASRTDKLVPVEAILQHFMSIQYPMYGDFDEIKVCGDNLHT